jgi:hypothetical protein
MLRASEGAKIDMFTSRTFIFYVPNSSNVGYVKELEIIGQVLNKSNK